MKKTNTTHIKAFRNFSDVPPYPAKTVKLLIEKLGQTERTFAAIMNVSEYTVKLWVTGAVRPCTTARRLMSLLDKNPETLELMFTAKEDG